MSSIIFLTCGFPGCGKSTYLEGAYPDRVILCPDDFRKVLTGQEFYAPAEDSVWSHVKTAARVLVGNGKVVIIDATHLTVGSRAQWIRIADQLKVPIECAYFNIPFETCLERNNARERVVPEDIMQRMAESFVEPSVEEGFRFVRIITLDDQTKTSGSDQNDV